MNESCDLEERKVQHGTQFVLYKNGIKYVSATVCNNRTVLVQGLDTCVDWKNKYYDWLNNNIQNCTRENNLENSTVLQEDDETAPKQIDMSDIENVIQTVSQPTIDAIKTVPKRDENELNTTIKNKILD